MKNLSIGKYILYGLGALCLLILVVHPIIRYLSDLQALRVYAQDMEEDATKTIVLDAGHGGYDSGGVSMDGYLEKDITLSLTKEIGAILSDSGYTIVYTRESDEVSWPSDNRIDLESRVQIGEEAQADYFISIHTNASVYGDGASGFESYINGQDATMSAMAENIGKQIEALQYTSYRGIKSTADSSLYVIDKNPVPAILLEVGFLTDTNDTNYFVSTANQKALAVKIANGIIETLA